MWSAVSRDQFHGQYWRPCAHLNFSTLWPARCSRLENCVDVFIGWKRSASWKTTQLADFLAANGRYDLAAKHYMDSLTIYAQEQWPQVEIAIRSRVYHCQLQGWVGLEKSAIKIFNKSWKFRFFLNFLHINFLWAGLCIMINNSGLWVIV